MATPIITTAQLTDAALAAGAAGCGVCAADPFPEVEAAMRERVEAGSHGGMGFTYTDPAVATDIKVSFPWAERLVVAAWPYLPAAGNPGVDSPGTGRIARFATDDHYRGLSRALDSVAAVLLAAGHRAEPIHDDSRLVDRAAAVRAGVGWWGKNSMVLTPGHGPWLLLGSVVTDASLELSSPMARGCGTCSACLPACPTGALVAPGVLDARSCLAHVLQDAGVIPRRLRAAVGDRVYGCDDCLAACPPGAKLSAESVLPAGRVDLFTLLAQSDDELLNRYGHFFLPGRRPRYLRRNALVALGNAAVGSSQARAAALPVLAGYLGHTDWLLRLHAAWSLGRIDDGDAAAVLSFAGRRERNGDVRHEIVHALGGADPR